MLRNLNIVFVALISFGCATSSRQTNTLLKDSGSLPTSHRLLDVPMIKQKRNHCGPATMAMAMGHAKKNVSLDELTSQMFTDKMDGTFQTDMLSAARRQGMLAMMVPDLTSLLKEVSSGHPVIVFQNLGLSWWPKWHYAVVTGYDLDGPDVYLHTGSHESQKTDMRIFERSWRLGGYWGLLILRSDQLSESSDEASHVRAASMLESLGNVQDAHTAYKSIHKKWPGSLLPLIGLGNVTFSQKLYKESRDYLHLATELFPKSSVAWHNLATVQEKLKTLKLARDSAHKAITLADETDRPVYEKNLKKILEQ